MGSGHRPPAAAGAPDPDGGALPVDPGPQLRQGGGGELGIFGLEGVAQQTFPVSQRRGHQGPVGVALGAGQGEAGLNRLAGLDFFSHSYLKYSGQ